MIDRGSKARAAPDAEAAVGAPASATLPQSFFRTVVETANEGIWMIGLEGRTTFANDRMAAMLGLTSDMMQGHHPSEYLFAEDLPLAADVIRRTLAGERLEFEPRFWRSDRTELPTLGGTAPIRDDEGRIIGAVATFSDLSARKAAEDALSQSEQEARRTADLLNKLLESALDSIWMRDAEGRYRVANHAARSVFGQTDSIVGMSIEEVWGAEIAQRLKWESEAMFAKGSGIMVEEEMFDAGRGVTSTFLSNMVPLFDTDGTPLGILGVSRDITDRKRAEDDLRASETRLAQQVAELNALYDSAPIGLAFFDRDYRYVRINGELASINGVPVDEHVGRTLREIVPVNAPQVEPVIDRVFETGQAVRDLEVTGETPQQPDVERHWLTGFYPVFAENGMVEAVGAWVVEISERKAAEQREVLLAREVDHRAKNLLAVVQSIVTLTPSDDDDLKSSVVGRIQALARAHSLLSDSRWDGVDLGQLIEEELAPFATRGRSPPHASGPPLKLRPAAAQSLALVLHELATNAAKYGALSVDSGELRVEWHREQDESGSSLVIEWKESGGPTVSQPESLSFGSNIIRTSVERQLRGKVTKDWRPEGLLCTIRVPAVEAVPASESSLNPR